MTLGAGTYYYNNVSISGTGRLSFTGPATVYVSGTMSISGNGIGTTGNLPTNLTVYVLGSGAVSFSGNGAFYGAVYAPQSAVATTGNGGVYGALIGNAVTVTGNGGVHYDEALGDVTGASPATLDLWSQP